jgi:4,5-dihydroxyphthalate decarboxylase
MSKLRLTLAAYDYDRTRPLADGRVAVEGVDINYLTLRPEETFFRALRHREFDVMELSITSYVLSKFDPADPYVAIPVFPSRMFRHGCIFINEASGIRKPGDLVGKRVGTPEYQMTATVWLRGILSDEYVVPVPTVTYVTGGIEDAGRPEKLPLDLPPGIRVEPASPGQTLSALLASGGIDALYSPHAPSSFVRGEPGVRRLWPDYVAVEREYFRLSKIFPIMHVIAMRRSTYEQHPWIAMSLYKAFVLAKELAYADLRRSGVLQVMLPWVAAERDATRALMGEDYWPYGVEANEKTLDAFTRYAFEQGIAKRRLAARELFAPETLESYKL